MDENTLRARIQRELDKHGNAKLKTMMRSLVPLQMVLPLCTVAGLDPDKYCNQVNAQERDMLLHHLKNLHFPVTGHGGWEEAIITSGGIHLKEVNPSTLESKVLPGLHSTGKY
ncbi:MAG: NAD(P)/FAD-dependent oxidoreductase [Candidatus Marinimicrobia bacterium]|nr:NAD(P)/FAD-dependent oxidoreductase [Candidatus Neomarinimicrobiota bacterium]